MTVIKNQSDKQKAEKNKNWGGAREECLVIKKHADEWCKDNGYPVRKRKRTRYPTANFILP